MNTPSSSSSDPLETNYCRLCKATTPTTAAWLAHLCSTVHQMMMRSGGSVAGKTEHWDRSRSIKITCCYGVSSSSILEYISGWGAVEDFSYITKTDGVAPFCFALMRFRMNANSMAYFTKPHIVSPTGKRINISIWRNTKKEHKKTSKQPYFWTYNEDQVPKLQSELDVSEAGCSTMGLEPAVSSAWGEFNCVCCTTISYSLPDWVIHLSSDPHRKNTKGLRAWDHRKSILLRGLKGLTKTQIISWGLSWGHVSDFLCYPKLHEGDDMYLLFQEEEVTNKILSFKDYHLTCTRKLDVLPVSEFSGFTKQEKLMLKAEKITTEPISITSSSLSTAHVENDGDDPLEVERTALVNLLQGKPFEEQLTLFCNHCSWSDTLHQSADRFLRDVLVFVIRRLEPPLNTMCQLIPYGPYGCRTGLANNKILHLLLNVQTPPNNTTFDLEQFPAQVDLVHKLRLGLESSVNFVSGSLHALGVANRPTIMFSTASDPQLDLHIRIDTNNLLVSQEASLISHYCALDPRVRQLLQIVIQWNYIHTLVKSPDELFPTHLISMIVIFFLVHKNILPSLHQLCEDLSPRTPIMVKGYDISFPKSVIHQKVQTELKDPSILALSVAGLLKGFFQFYGWVDIYNNVFCVRLGSLVSKDHFFSGNLSNLPDELRELYTSGEGQLHTVSPLVVQDPFVLSMNLAKSRGKKTVCSRFIHYCRRGFTALEAGFMNDLPSMGAIFEKHGIWVDQNSSSLE